MQQTNDPNDDSDVGIQLTDQERDQMIAENVASIEAVPQGVWDALPEGQHNRTFALMWASQGRDVYAYKGFGEHGLWNLWLAGQRIELGRPAEGGAE